MSAPLDFRVCLPCDSQNGRRLNPPGVARQEEGGGEKRAELTHVWKPLESLKGEGGREGGKVPVTAGGGVTLESCNNCLRWCSEDAEP